MSGTIDIDGIEEATAYSEEHIEGFDSDVSFRFARVSRSYPGMPPTDYVAYNEREQIEADFEIDEYHVEIDTTR